MFLSFIEYHVDNKKALKFAAPKGVLLKTTVAGELSFSWILYRNVI